MEYSRYIFYIYRYPVISAFELNYTLISYLLSPIFKCQKMKIYINMQMSLLLSRTNASAGCSSFLLPQLSQRCTSIKTKRPLNSPTTPPQISKPAKRRSHRAAHVPQNRNPAERRPRICGGRHLQECIVKLYLYRFTLLLQFSITYKSVKKAN